jgi:hypothetical protein
MVRRAHYEFMAGVSHNTMVALGTQDTSLSSLEAEVDDLQARAAFKDEANVFTESQTIDKGAANADLHIAADDGFYAALSFEGTGNLSRWNFVKSATGSNFAISRFDSGGTLVDTPINISWATGVVDFTEVPTVGGTVLPTGASLSAIGALTPVADWFPYFTSGTTAALANISTAGRNFLNDTTALQQRATLGFTFVTPEDFGATGGADDTTACQAFLDALAATTNSFGLLTRWYNIQATNLSISGAVGPFTLMGIGRYACGFRVNDATFADHVLTVDTCDAFTLRGFGLDGDEDGGATPIHALRMENCNTFLVQDIYCYDWETGGGVHAVTCLQGRFLDLHLNGTNKAGNGINFVNSVSCYVGHSFVENVNNESTCMAFQFKGDCSHGVMENCQAENCFAGFAMHGDDAATPLYGRDQHFRNVSVYNPNANSTAVGAFPVGVRFWNCADCTATDVTIDGNDLDDFVAIQVSNGDETGPTVLKGNGTVRASVYNCQGADSYVLLHEAPRTIVYLDQIAYANAQPIKFNADAIDGKIIIGKRSSADIFAPWRLLDTSGGIGTNMTIEMVTPAVRYVSLADDTMFELAIPDAESGRLSVWTGNPDEQFEGWVRVTASPDFDSFHTGTEVTVGTTLLTSATDASTVDTDLNIAISNNLIQVSNRRGGTREVGLKFESVN